MCVSMEARGAWCVCTWVWVVMGTGDGETCACTCVGMEATGTTGCFPLELTTLVLFTGLSLKGWLAKELRRFFSPALGFQAYTTTPVFLRAFWGSKFRSRRPCSKHFTGSPPYSSGLLGGTWGPPGTEHKACAC